MKKNIFKVEFEDKNTSARAGVLETYHGIIETPIFMPVGTAGSVKSLSQQHLYEQVHAQIILGNTYHLYLRPQTKILEACGGLHKFMGWDRPILTDSGGFQVFSLKETRKISQEGVHFKSIIDGSPHFFSPESVMETQSKIGADIIMAFDECLALPATEKEVLKSMELTHQWYQRCAHYVKNNPPLYHYQQTLFPIIQGGVYEPLRKASCDFLSPEAEVGIAIGGLSVGEPTEQMYDITAFCCQNIPSQKARYLMGVGMPANILECISLGIDMFDCVIPTRNGRNGMLFTTQGIINIKNQKWATDFSVLDETIQNNYSNYYSKAYLRHLFVAGELLAYQIASIHNLSFYLWLVKTARTKIISGEFHSWKNQILPIINQRLSSC